MGIVTVASPPAAEGAAARLRVRLPYDLQAQGFEVYIADGLRHQVLRLDLRTRKLTVFAGMGVAGSSGDKAPRGKRESTSPPSSRSTAQATST